MNFHTHNPMSRLMKSQIKEPRARALLFFNLNIDNESDVQVIDTTIDSHVTIRSFKRLLPPYLKIVKNVKSLSFSLSYRIYVITFLPFNIQMSDIELLANTIAIMWMHRTVPLLTTCSANTRTLRTALNLVSRDTKVTICQHTRRS